MGGTAPSLSLPHFAYFPFFAAFFFPCNLSLTPRSTAAPTPQKASAKQYRATTPPLIASTAAPLHSSNFCNIITRYIAVKDTVQEHIAKEIEEIYSRKTGGQVMAFQDLWRYKGRLVRGQEKTL